MKTKLFSFAFLLCSLFAFGQIVNIPDANFKAKLFAYGIDKGNGTPNLEQIDFANNLKLTHFSQNNLAKLTYFNCQNTSLVGLNFADGMLTKDLQLFAYPNTYLSFICKDIGDSFSTNSTFPNDIIPSNGKCYPRIALSGSSLNGNITGWDSDIEMITEDGINYHIDKYNFFTGVVKFKQNYGWTKNWGSISFPMGIGVQDGENIPLNKGEYKVSFIDYLEIMNFHRPYQLII